MVARGARLLVDADFGMAPAATTCVSEINVGEVCQVGELWE